MHYSKFDIIFCLYLFAIVVIDMMYSLNIIVVLRHLNSRNYFVVNSSHYYSEWFTCNSLTQNCGNPYTNSGNEPLSKF
jgi:hypothetical protein